MKILESILDDLDAQSTSAAHKISEDDNKLIDPFHDDGEFDLLLSIPVTVVDGKDYEPVKRVQSKLYEFLDMHPAIKGYSRIMIGTVFHFFENDPDVSHEISNRLNRFDTIFQVAIKLNFRTFMDVSSFILGVNSIVNSKGSFSCPIQYIKRNPETNQWYFDWKVFTTSCRDEGIELSYFINETALKAKNRHLNVREFIDIINLCEMLTKGHVTMNMVKKICAGISFSLYDKLFENLMGDTLRDVNVPGFIEFISDSQLNAKGLSNKNDASSISVCSYFQVVPLNKINSTSIIYSGRYGVSYKDDNERDSERKKVIDFLLKNFDGRPIARYKFNRIYKNVYENAPVKLALWLDISGIPGYSVPCVVLFVMSIDKPNQMFQLEEFIFRFRHLFKRKPTQELLNNLTNDLFNDGKN